MTDFAKVNCVFKPDRKLNPTEMLRAIKFAVSSEFEAIQIYQQIMESTDDKRIINVLKEITEDEKKHVGGLYKLLEFLSPADNEIYQEGYAETVENFTDGE
ncbi:MAG: rubrerythrin [Alphaproteobacteria bacterium]|nr:rubrerythrin [Alphaproteobacteria bacterium]